MNSKRKTDGGEIAVGDMTEQGQTNLGPIPELGDIENLAQADRGYATEPEDPQP